MIPKKRFWTEATAGDAGEILLDGQPLDTGSIEFSPHEHAGVRSGTMIENGAYAIPGNKGLPPGKYLVRIFSPVEAAPPPEEPSVPGPTVPGPVGPSQPPPGVERIPPEFNEESEEVIDVTEAGPNEFNFDIRTN